MFAILGSNLSQGQRQLISLARALLTPSNILVLDEATVSHDFLYPSKKHPIVLRAFPLLLLFFFFCPANFEILIPNHSFVSLQAAVDVETDALLQQMLRSNIFRDRTIITIAHRINTILDSDRIVVLDHGSVAEFDTPAALIQRRGQFYELVKEAGLLETSVSAGSDTNTSTPTLPS